MVSKDEFVNVWNEVNSPSRVAKELNLDLRSVYRRRRRLESEGYVLPTHTPGSNIRHAYKLETELSEEYIASCGS
jgi:DNA-binding Lrp family transcriptional regulator